MLLSTCLERRKLLGVCPTRGCFGTLAGTRPTSSLLGGDHFFYCIFITRQACLKAKKKLKWPTWPLPLSPYNSPLLSGRMLPQQLGFTLTGSLAISPSSRMATTSASLSPACTRLPSTPLWLSTHIGSSFIISYDSSSTIYTAESVIALKLAIFLCHHELQTFCFFFSTIGSSAIT